MNELQDDDAKRDEVRFFARYRRQLFDSSQASALEEHSAMARWLTASLLAINGAGGLATFNAADRLSHVGFVGALFVAGVLAALLSGVANQHANDKTAILLTDASVHAAAVEHFGIDSEESERIFSTVGAKIAAVGIWPARFGWISALLFTAGCIGLGVDPRPIDQAALNRCAAIQADMLSAKPRRSDDAALFQALGCKPRGEGSVFAPPPPRTVVAPK